jgi:hypothetical protein
MLTSNTLTNLTATISGTASSIYISSINDGAIAVGSSSGRGRDKKKRKQRIPTLRPDPNLSNIFITNRRTGRTKTFHDSFTAIAFLCGKDLDSYIILKDSRVDPTPRIPFLIFPTSNRLEDLQLQLDSIA